MDDLDYFLGIFHVDKVTTRHIATEIFISCTLFIMCIP